ncbi:hypothetical protein Taro_024283 [Colocasia esculenta]|uniref:Uncharacterized protein n=1 Tax=Colocasia esculenta TaxID=4460 RepID=A0A843VAV9_COLES|nr:hypothetical protein [Colocasia esculenta]
MPNTLKEREKEPESRRSNQSISSIQAFEFSSEPVKEVGCLLAREREEDLVGYPGCCSVLEGDCIFDHKKPIHLLSRRFHAVRNLLSPRKPVAIAKDACCSRCHRRRRRLLSPPPSTSPPPAVVTSSIDIPAATYFCRRRHASLYHRRASLRHRRAATASICLCRPASL